MAILRHVLVPVEAAVYGVSYAFLQNIIRSPTPLDAEWTWHAVTREQDHVLGISAHYDVSNDFYKLFLDKKYMFYTCADFHSPHDTLEQAQQNKADFICKLIDPHPGERILELGCGWGSMLHRLHEETGDKDNLFGLTLSREQKAYNDEHNHFNVEFDDFITRDYAPESFDKIYSIGAWEHVRSKEIPPLLKKLHRALRPGGRLVKHFFLRANDGVIGPVACSQIYFPGSMGESYRYHSKAWEAAGFRIAHCSVHDYRQTLRAWFDRLVAHKEEALKLVNVQTYNRYLTFFPASWRYFNDRYGIVTRWVLEKR
jgi:cyclopropane-fatty-acyl-phospholipid synthase